MLTRNMKMLIALLATMVVGLGTAAVPATSLADTPAGNSAVAWAQAQEGSTNWDGLCLQFVSDAYSQAGISLASQAGDSSSAISFWNSYGGAKYPASATPPAGALVVYDATSSNPYGHIAISEGNGMAISSEERSYTGVHEFTIANRDAQGYVDLGYVIPG